MWNSRREASNLVFKIDITHVQTKSFKFLRKFTHGKSFKFLVCYNCLLVSKEIEATKKKMAHTRVDL
jgi:hypothetical protein